jgi:hypothetical protein
MVGDHRKYKENLLKNYHLILRGKMIFFIYVMVYVDPGHNPNKFKFDMATLPYHDPYI